MLFVLSKVIQPMLWPLNISLLLLLAAVIFARGRRRLTIAALILLFIFSSSPLLLPLRCGWENAYPGKPLSEYPARDAIVVLGGSMPYTLAPRYEPEELFGARVLTGARLFRAGKAPILLCSGGVPYQGVGGVRTESDDMCQLAQEYGVPAAAQIREGKSRTTYENALYTRDLLLPKGKSHILLVTAAGHMKRAAALYTKAGFDVTPVPNGWFCVGGMPGWWPFPEPAVLLGNTLWLKEVIGYYFYRAIGRA